ncbi:sensor histidine kinase [Arenimonas sp. MALMAid1274]|uniref:sensor histidine kinase n=1 Tax=Arenimonas sp. MALMAid1274 TaxID=3411630 RepID=UPI003BA18B10
MNALTGPKAQERSDIHDSPWVSLAYLVFVFVPLAFSGRWSATAWIASVGAVLVFLPMHFGFYRATGRRRGVLALAVAALGFALIPFNPGGHTFIIYAAGMLGWAVPARWAIGLTVLLVALASLEFWWTLPNVALAMGWSTMLAVIAILVLAGTLFGRAKARRDAELRLTQDEVGRLAAMAERERIGRDLHDLLGHTLSLVAIKSELAGRLVERDPQAAKRQIGEVEAVARQALAQVREAVVGIRATGLQAELAATRLALLSADIRLDQSLAPLALPANVESALAMALREATTNVLRHARASRVDVELAQHGGEWRLSIADDGRGGIVTPGTGLAGMRERVAAFDGRVDIDSPAGGGTRLTVSVPVTALPGPAP